MNDCDVRIAELRQRAEETIKSETLSMEKMPVEDVRKLVEELRIHQVELEMQNEELRSTQWELEQSRKEYSDLGGKPKTAKIPSNENDSPIPSYASSRQAVTVCFKPRFLM